MPRLFGKKTNKYEKKISSQRIPSSYHVSLTTSSLQKAKNYIRSLPKVLKKDLHAVFSKASSSGTWSSLFFPSLSKPPLASADLCRADSWHVDVKNRSRVRLGEDAAAGPRAEGERLGGTGPAFLRRVQGHGGGDRGTAVRPDHGQHRPATGPVET